MPRIVPKIKISDLSELDLFPESRERDLTNDEINEIFCYLKNPVSSGIWLFNSKWDIDKNDSIGQYFKNQYEENIKNRARRRTPEQEERDKKRYYEQISRFSHYLQLFHFLYIKEKTEGKDLTDEDILRYNLQYRDYSLFRNINIDYIKEKYKIAFEIYKSRIVYDEFNPKIGKGKLFKMNEGCLLLVERTENSIVMISLNKNSLNIIGEFLDSLNIVSGPKIKRIFSPSESLFKPYVWYLEEIYRKAIENEDYQKSIGIAISEYRNGHYSYCINTIGILTEHILTEIYESIFREEADEKLTLGEQFQKIQNLVQEIIKPKKITTPINSSILFSDVNSLFSKIGINPTEDIQKETIELIRKIIQYEKEQTGELNESIKKVLKTYHPISIFPNERLENIREIIYYRNAIAHKSRIPIGDYESVRSVFSCFTLYCWWREDVDIIDWSQSKEEIIKFLVDKSKNP